MVIAHGLESSRNGRTGDPIKANGLVFEYKLNGRIIGACQNFCVHKNSDRLKI
jgi:hypothetical protein